MRRHLRAALGPHRNLTIAVVLLLLTVGFAVASGYWLMYRMAYGLFLLLPLSYLWARYNVSGLRVEVDRSVDRVEAGHEAESRITVTNTGRFRKLWLEVEDASDLPGYAPRRVMSLGGGGHRTWRIRVRCLHRGLYRVGPVRITSSDPFGLFRFSREFGRPGAVLVYPPYADLSRFAVPPANLPGDGRYRRRTHYVTPNAAGVREYHYGDSFNRIHWKSTARTGELMVKMFELDPSSDVWILHDLHRDAQAGRGEESTEEYGVRVVASIARYFLLANRSVGYIGFGADLDVVEADRGPQQFTRILEALALARARGDVPFSDLITEESRRFGRHTTVVAVTPSTDDSWVLALQGLSQRGVRVAAVLLEPETFGSSRTSLLVYGTLAAGEVLTYSIKRGDDIGAVLEGRSVAAEAAEAARPPRAE